MLVRFRLVFFLSGCAFGYFEAFPVVVGFLVGMGTQFNAVITINEYLSTATKIILGLGLCFELPIVIFFLTRMGVVSEYRKGRLARHEVCDAHPELKRAAQSASEPTDMECPICEEDRIVLVTYAFGARLPASGRCITTKGELAKLAKGRSQLAAYVVEVCPSCSWNHLAKTFLLGTG